MSDTVFQDPEEQESYERDSALATNAVITSLQSLSDDINPLPVAYLMYIQLIHYIIAGGMPVEVLRVDLDAAASLHMQHTAH